ncbi:substrate-binding domain-containing protein [Devosia sp. A8/3-2]|nr:substrate-binding domain-containing protein [Devosia sp. A8/3-2]
MNYGRRINPLVVALGLASLMLPMLPAAAQDAGIKPPAEVAAFGAIEPGIGEGLTIGFTQLGTGVPFTEALQRGMEAGAAVAGVKLITCDSKFDAAAALDCARQFRTQNVDGLVTFRADAAAAANICAEGPQVPVIAIDIEQQPCQTAFVGAANAYAGEIVGYALGQYFKANFDCKYDARVSLESLAVGVVNDLRMGGMRDGFCPSLWRSAKPAHHRYRRWRAGRYCPAAGDRYADRSSRCTARHHRRHQ